MSVTNTAAMYYPFGVAKYQKFGMAGFIKFQLTSHQTDHQLFNCDCIIHISDYSPPYSQLYLLIEFITLCLYIAS